MRNFKTLVFALAITVLAGGCATTKEPGTAEPGQVEKIYKPGADNVHTVKGKSEQANFKKAREHCKGDFQVIKKGRVHEADMDLETLEFKCI